MAYLRVIVLLWADLLAAYVMFIMQKYLTDVWNLGFTRAALIMNIANGLPQVLPLLFYFFVDVGLGNKWMLLLSSLSFVIGLGFLSMSTPPVLAKATGTCKDYKPECIGHTQKALFYTALALIAVGISGHIVSLVALFVEQFKKKKPERNQTELKDFRDELPANYGDGTLELLEAIQIKKGLKRKLPSFLKRQPQQQQQQLPLPPRPPNNQSRNEPGGTSPEEVDLLSLQFQPVEAMLALVTREKKKVFRSCLSVLVPVIAIFVLPYIKPWSLRFGIPAICTLVATIFFLQGFRGCKEDRSEVANDTQVEKTRIIIRMFPILITLILCGLVTSMGSTYFVEQSSHMNYKLGKWKLPDSLLLILYASGKAGSKYVYTGVASLFGNRYAPKTGIALATISATLCCIVAALVEKRRIRVIRDNGLIDKPDEDIPMTVFWLLPQYLLLAGLDSFYENSVTPFLRYQSPPSLEKYFVFLNPGLSGLGVIGSVLSVYVVGRVSERHGKPNWFQHDLNGSRLDRYYWVIAALSAANFVWFLLCAILYPYNAYREITSNPDEEMANEAGKQEEGGAIEMASGFIADMVEENMKNQNSSH